MNKVHYIKESKYYKYRLRCCSNCSNEAICNETKAEGSTWLSCAKCGCVHYHNSNATIMAESPYKRCDADD